VGFEAAMATIRTVGVLEKGEKLAAKNWWAGENTGVRKEKWVASVAPRRRLEVSGRTRW
jgi:purine nucleoside permease